MEGVRLLEGCSKRTDRMRRTRALGGQGMENDAREEPGMWRKGKLSCPRALCFIHNLQRTQGPAVRGTRTEPGCQSPTAHCIHTLTHTQTLLHPAKGFLPSSLSPPARTTSTKRSCRNSISLQMLCLSEKSVSDFCPKQTSPRSLL